MHETMQEYGQIHIEIYPDRVTFDSGHPVIIFSADFSGSLFDQRAVEASDCNWAAVRALAGLM
jgi:hypothetical protein